MTISRTNFEHKPESRPIDTSKFEGHTPGGWRVGDARHTVFAPPCGLPPKMIAQRVSPRDAALIAAAPDLLAEVERLRAEVEELKETRATLMGAAVKNGVQLAELREAAGNYFSRVDPHLGHDFDDVSDALREILNG